jgi:hypothetical protein
MQSDTFTRTGGDGKSVTVYRSLLGEERITAVTHLPSSTSGNSGLFKNLELLKVVEHV